MLLQNCKNILPNIAKILFCGGFFLTQLKGYQITFFITFYNHYCISPNVGRYFGLVTGPPPPPAMAVMEAAAAT